LRNNFYVRHCLEKETEKPNVPPPARDLEGRTPKKNVLSFFKKNFTTTAPEKQGGGGTTHSISGFCWKKVRILFRRHS